jgi:hypothetical protein
MFGLVVRPCDLEDNLTTLPRAGWRHPRGVAARKERLADLEGPLARQGLDGGWQPVQPFAPAWLIGEAEQFRGHLEGALAISAVAHGQLTTRRPNPFIPNSSRPKKNPNRASTQIHPAMWSTWGTRAPRIPSLT